MVDSVDVNFRLLSGKQVTLSLPSGTPISDVKALIAAQCDIAPENQRLIYRGQQLLDSSTVGSCNLESGATVHVVGNVAAPSSSQQQQSPQGNSRPSKFSEAMASSMSSLMREFMAPQGGDGAARNPFSALSAVLGNAASRQGNDQGGDTSRGSAAADQLLQHGMKLAQKLTESNSEFGDIASKLLSGMMGGMMKPDGHRPGESSGAGANSTSSSSRAADAAVHQTAAKTSESEEDASATQYSAVAAVSSAKGAIDAVYDLMQRAPDSSSDGSANMHAPSERKSLMNLETDLALSRTPNGLFLEDTHGLNSNLPWTFLQLLEKEVAQVKGTGAPKREIGNAADFMARYREVVARAAEITSDLADWSTCSRTMDANRFSRISSICSLQAALQSEMSLIATTLRNKVLKMDKSSSGASQASASVQHSQPVSAAADSTTSTTAHPGVRKTDTENQAPAASAVTATQHHTHHHSSGGSATSCCAHNSGESHRHHGQSPNFGDMFSSLGRIAESALKQMQRPQRTTVVDTSSNEEDMLVDTTWLRRQFNQYRNSTGFQSRMEDLVRKTKKFGAAYCTGTGRKRPGNSNTI
ncbi:ubiquitin family domain containing protein, putative [Babesia bigemina]|uniref:Ubiquitin family domain containing protein, putative n=1 Tax=Babesia bigemina TaxID=5866 RepID=A0A061DAQ4_BABBI|nr:ubiquitin family domain containing protein, putative [Babesia bigemina]CDR95994.1 ubiquitin family domain containing protein, putative [Babesia bigemina]|eukprot:XP_012768180.1 ubiquitin family domain containing protein, putative [Babesia bigemina]